MAGRTLRRWMAAALACVPVLLALFPAVTPTVRAEGSVYFTAVEDNLLPLTGDTMPFWNGGYLYIPTSVFSGKQLGVSRGRIGDGGVVLTNQSGESLLYKAGQPYAQDGEGDTYSPGVLQRNGDYFVPASLTARILHFQYSVKEVENGYLVWLRRASNQMGIATFASAVSVQMRQEYQAYLKSLEPPAPPEPDPEPEPAPIEENPVLPPVPEPETPSIPETPPASPDPVPPEPVRPSAPEPVTPEPIPVVPEPPKTETPAAEEPETPPDAPKEPSETPVSGGQNLYLCFRNGTEALLDALDRYGVRGTFFCDEAFLRDQGDLVRRMTASGHAVGLLVDPSDPDRTLAAQMNQGNQILEQAACRKTRLVLLAQGGNEAAYQELREAGGCGLRPALERSILRTSGQAQALLALAGRQGSRVSVLLGENVTQAGLLALLDAASDAGDACLPLTETAFS